ncbi:MAG: hypothetical protein ABSA11_08805 [Candidatus Bathyarchaeia archaeon]|jgi:hypothetical protein
MGKENWVYVNRNKPVYINPSWRQEVEHLRGVLNDFYSSEDVTKSALIRAKRLAKDGSLEAKILLIDVIKNTSSSSDIHNFAVNLYNSER